jgi:hypothetical protein
MEVKELDPPVSQSALYSGLDELSRRFAKFSGKCNIHAWIGPGFNAQVANQAAHLVQWLTARP